MYPTVTETSKKGERNSISIMIVLAFVLGFVHQGSSANLPQDNIKRYHLVETSGPMPVTEDIEVNTEKNELVVHLEGDGIEPGTIAAFDYETSIAGFYDPKNQACLLIGGINRDIEDPKTFNEHLAKNITESIRSTTRYQISYSYPVTNKAILPSPLKNACADLPVYWLEPISDKRSRGKRSCHYRCTYEHGRRHCGMVCGW